MAGVVPLGLEFLLFNRAGTLDRVFFICACFLFNRAGGRGYTALFALAFFLTVPVVGTVPLYLRFLLF